MNKIDPRSFWFTFMLAAMSTLPPFSIDTGLPAFLQTAEALHTTPARMALTLSFFMAGFAVAPILIGPLADRYGRRSVLLSGCILYTIAAVGCALAGSISTLLAWRFVQGTGASSGRVLSMAIIRDLYEGPAAQAKLSYVNLIVGIAPMIAPTVGAWILVWFGWRAIYATLAAGGLFLLLLLWFGYAESMPKNSDQSLTPGRLARNYWRVLSHRACLGYTLVSALCFGCLFTYISGSSLVMMGTFGVTPRVYGFIFASTAVSVMAGAFINGKLSLRGVRPSRLLVVGLIISMLSTILMFIFSILNIAMLATLLPLLMLCCGACGLILPNAAHGAIEPLPEIAGTASALFSGVQMIGGAVAASLFGAMATGHPIYTMSFIMAACAGGSVLFYYMMIHPIERRSLTTAAQKEEASLIES